MPDDQQLQRKLIKMIFPVRHQFINSARHEIQSTKHESKLFLLRNSLSKKIKSLKGKRRKTKKFSNEIPLKCEVRNISNSYALKLTCKLCSIVVFPLDVLKLSS